MIPNSKKSMELSIPLLVFMTIALCISALVVFNLNSGNVSSNIRDYALLDSIKIHEKLVNFYIRDIFENSISKMPNGKDVRTEFLKNFKEEMKRYKNSTGYKVKELEQLDSQLLISRVNVEDKRISIIFKIEMGKEFPDQMTVVYAYEKEFSGMLK